MNDSDSIKLPTLEEIIDRKPLTVDLDISIADAIALMSQVKGKTVPLENTRSNLDLVPRKSSSSYVVVLKERKLVGVFTERDVVKLIASGRDLSQLTLAEVVNREPIALRKSEAGDIFSILSMMRQYRIRHLPVVGDKDRLIGIITHASIREILDPSALLKMRCVSEIMSDRVIQSTGDESVFNLARLMYSHRVSCVVIVENKEIEKDRSISVPVGILTERDLVQFRVLEVDLEQIQASEVMSAPLFCISPSDSLWYVHQLMNKKRVRRLVVSGESGELAGIVTQTSLLSIFDPREMSQVIKLLEHKLEKQTTKLRQAHKQFEQIQRLESIGTLAGGVAHDLNNILTPLLGGAQLLSLRIPDLDPETRQLLELIVNNSQQAADLVQQLLLFSQQIDPKLIELKLDVPILNVENFISKTLPKYIKIETHIAKNLFQTKADPTQINQVLMNLCLNAKDAMTDCGGTVCIEARNFMVDENYARLNLEAKVGNYVMITVSDTGVGIPPENMERIFEPFFTTKEGSQGTGLGLSTIRGIIKNHNGFLTVSSRVCQGSQFSIYLPAIKVEENSIAGSQPLNPYKGDGELILVVDDEASILEISRITLETHNYKVLTAKDGLEAIALHHEYNQEIKAIVMDMMMPEMDGITALQVIQKINPRVKAIAISGLVSHNKIDMTKMPIVENFLAKPYKIEDLLLSLHEIVNKSDSLSVANSDKYSN